MAKVSLQLGAELDILNKNELADALDRHDSWLKDAAYGVRQQDLQRMYGKPASGDLNLGADQADGQYCGPGAGWMWAVHRISVDGLASGDTVKVYKLTKFIGIVSATAGFITFGKGQCTLRPDEYLRVTGTGLTATGQIEVFGEALSAPMVMQWKVLT